VSYRPYTLAPLPTKVENFIRRLEQETQARINIAFDYIVRSPFQHENPTTIKPLHGNKKGLYRYRIGDLRFIYQVDREERLIHIVQIDNRGDIY
jgi:mRNA interferase RelE/StbE